MSVRVSTLANGLRVATDTMKTVETVSVGVWVEAGARHERAEINGVSHILEHMAFKGTKRRSAQDIAEEIEAVGGHINAYTSRENTAYYAKVLKEDLALAVDVIADIVQNPVLDAQELARERAVIIQEINQSHDTPDDAVFDNFQETAFPDQALGRPVLGVEERVRDIGRDTILAYLHGHYGAPSMVLAAAGQVDHERLVGLAESALAGALAEKGARPDPARYEGGDHREDRDLEQLHVVLGFEGLTHKDEDFYAASVLSTILGGGMSSRLFQEVREKRGLVYSIYTFLSPYTNSGLFGVYAGTGAPEIGEVIPLICDEIQKIRGDVSDQEMSRARAQLKSSILMSLESTSSRCEQLARQLIVFGRPLSVDEIIAKVEAVDADAVKRVAKRLTGGRPTVTGLGPIGGLEDFDRVAERLA